MEIELNDLISFYFSDIFDVERNICPFIGLDLLILLKGWTFTLSLNLQSPIGEGQQREDCLLELFWIMVSQFASVRMYLAQVE